MGCCTFQLLPMIATVVVSIAGFATWQAVRPQSTALQKVDLRPETFRSLGWSCGVPDRPSVFDWMS